MSIMRPLMFSCKDVSGLLSLSFDKELSFGQKMRLKMHLRMCKLCARHKKQLSFIHDFLHNGLQDQHEALASKTLPTETKEQIKAKIRDHQK